MVHAYTQLCNVGGVVENAALFAQYLIVERDTDPNRLNAYLPIDVANQLVVFAANLTIFPQFDDSTVSLNVAGPDSGDMKLDVPPSSRECGD